MKTLSTYMVIGLVVGFFLKETLKQNVEDYLEHDMNMTTYLLNEPKDEFEEDTDALTVVELSEE